MKMPKNYYVDLQDEYFKITGIDRAGMSTMATRLIDPWYNDMKKKFHHKQHKRWGVIPLDKINLEYAAIDAWVAYELYRKIVLKKAVDGSSRGNKRQRRAYDALIISCCCSLLSIVLINADLLGSTNKLCHDLVCMYAWFATPALVSTIYYAMIFRQLSREVSILCSVPSGTSKCQRFKKIQSAPSFKKSRSPT